MFRKLIPIVVIALILIVILHKKQTSHDDTAQFNAATGAGAAPSSSKAYALDVRRENWPALQAGNSSLNGTMSESSSVSASGPPSALATTNYYVVLDGSGSMLNKECGGGTSKIVAAVAAVKQFFVTVPADANVGLAAFDRRAISERVALGVGNRAQLSDALATIRAGSDTPLRTAIQIGYDKLTAQARTQFGYGEYHLVVVTDGEPDPANEDPTPIVKEILAQSPVVLHTIGFCIDANHVLNQPNRTYYASATNPEQLQKSLQAVLAEAPSFDAAKFN